ncbi:MAG TPA: hypothetical protein VMV17_24720 [Streptosporangiaceae bacterium]|nr:hypothetical protein [Streptosporangiaceae bacterium]
MLDRARLGPQATAPALTVSHKGRKLGNPYLVQIRLINRGYRDITSAAFDQNRPFSIELGAPITALLDTVCQPPDRLIPAAVINGTAVDVGPALIRRRSAVTFYLLVDGGVERLEWESPLIHVDVDYAQPQAGSPVGINVYKVLGWAAVIFVVFYLVTDPGGAAQAMISLRDALKQAWSSLATFLSSL